jgi:hypothetical protein
VFLGSRISLLENGLIDPKVGNQNDMLMGVVGRLRDEGIEVGR